MDKSSLMSISPSSMDYVRGEMGKWESNGNRATDSEIHTCKRCISTLIDLGPHSCYSTLSSPLPNECAITPGLSCIRLDSCMIGYLSATSSCNQGECRSGPHQAQSDVQLSSHIIDK